MLVAKLRFKCTRVLWYDSFKLYSLKKNLDKLNEEEFAYITPHIESLCVVIATMVERLTSLVGNCSGCCYGEISFGVGVRSD